VNECKFGFDPRREFWVSRNSNHIQYDSVTVINSESRLDYNSASCVTHRLCLLIYVQSTYV
jgi:hypothetical protein